MLKNEAERRAFLENFETWGIWITVPELGMRMFKRDLPDGSRILVAQYMRSARDLVAFSNVGIYDYPHYHLILPGDTFSPSNWSMTELINHLKDIKVMTSVIVTRKD